MAISQSKSCASTNLFEIQLGFNTVSALITQPLAANKIQKITNDTCKGRSATKPIVLFKKSGNIYTCAANAPNSKPTTSDTKATSKNNFPTCVFIFVQSF